MSAELSLLVLQTRHGCVAEQELRTLAVEVLKATSQDECLAMIGQGSFSPQQLIAEVRNGSAVGRQFVGAVRQHGLFLEAALAGGNIRLKRQDHDLALPDFEF